MYSPPKKPLEILAKLDWDVGIGPDDPRWVDLDTARGSMPVRMRLAKKFGLDLADKSFVNIGQSHILLFGPIGCGKSTEIRRFVKEVEATGKLKPAVVSISDRLDKNNLRYADVLLCLAEEAVELCIRERILIDETTLRPLRDWFVEQIKTVEKATELQATLQTEASAGGGLPFIASLLAKITTAVKTNATYKTQLRDVVRNGFSQFADHFNALLAHVESRIASDKHFQRVLFVIDGTDKMTGDDARRFFVEDSEQLLAIRALVLYTAPLSLKYEGAAPIRLNSDLTLPIVKLHQRDGTRFVEGWAGLTALLEKRADPAAFASPDLFDRLIEMSGGHPRELMRLLKLCCEFAGSRIEAADVESAIDALAADYRMFLEPEDYRLLANIDQAGGEHLGNDARTCKLLHRLALLAYNNGSWRETHPVVRTLEGYKKAHAAGSLPSP